MRNLPVQIKNVLDQSNITDMTKAEQIAINYAPLMNEVTEQGKLLKALEKGNRDDLGKANRIKLDLGKICSRATDQKKIDKDILLLQTRFIDALFNAVNGAARLNQEEAKQIEQYFEDIEKERIAKLQLSRSAETSKFSDGSAVIPDFLGAMNDDVWSNYITGVKANYDARIEAERIAEEQRIKKEKAEIAERKRIANENIRLKKEAAKKEKQRVADEKERQRLAKIQADKLETERKERDRIAKIEAENIKKERQIQQAKIDAAKKEAAKLAAQLQSKRDNEIKAENDRLATVEAEANKGDSAKVADLKNALINIKSKYEFKSKKNQKMYTDVGILIEKVINHINK